MDQALLQQLALGAIPPGIIGAIIFFVLWLPRRAQAAASSDGTSLDFADTRGIIITLAIGCTLFLMHPFIMAGLRLPTWILPPRRASDWLPLVAIIGTLLAFAAMLLRAQRFHSLLVAIPVTVVAMAFGALAARRLITDSWSLQQSLAHVAGLGLFTYITTTGVLTLARRPGLVGVAALVIVAGSTANIMAGPLNSLKLAQWSGVSAAFLTPAALLALLRPAVGLPIAAVALVMLALSSVTTQAVVFGSASLRLTVFSLVMLAMSPWLGVVTGTFFRRDGLAKSLAQLAAVGLPGAVAMGVWLATQQAESGPDY